MPDFTEQVIKQIAESINLPIPQECLEGVKQNMQLLSEHGKLIHQFQIPK